jgi:hypothetical protein
MPKPMFVWSGSAWVSVASEVESLANFATQSYAAAQPATKMIVPTSVAVGSGSGAVDTNGAVTFSGASSVSLNGCFTSAYQNYSIIVNDDSASATGYQLFRLRTNGTDNSTSNYYSSGIYNVSTAGTPTGEVFSGTGATIKYMESTTTDAFTKMDISNPQLTKKTVYSLTSVRYASASVNYVNMGAFNSTTSFDGITFYPASGTITGTIRVYGYKN